MIIFTILIDKCLTGSFGTTWLSDHFFLSLQSSLALTPRFGQPRSRILARKVASICLATFGRGMSCGK